MFLSVVAHRSAVRIILVLTTCTSLLLVPNVPLVSDNVSAQGQGQSSKREGRPKSGKPEGSLPDLEDVQRESHVERDPAAPIPSTMRSPPSHQWVAFSWDTRAVQSSFSGSAVIGPKNSTVLPVITGVTLNDTSQITFDYNNSLQVYLIRDYFGALQRSETTFTYETPGSDAPRLTDSRISAHNWTGINGVPSQVITTYSVAGDGACVMTAPDGTIYKQYYGTGWQRGLVTLSEVRVGQDLLKWTTTAWTQDNTSVGYEVTFPLSMETMGGGTVEVAGFTFIKLHWLLCTANEDIYVQAACTDSIGSFNLEKNKFETGFIL